jgi:beta-lactamase superfamily II metal-dependent hydrolase
VEVYTLYAGQGNLTVVVGASEAVVVDAHVPPLTDPHADFVKRTLATIVAGKKVVGLMLTGFDADHADPTGVAWVLNKYQPRWIMYPKYRHLTGTAGEVFKVIKVAEARRSGGQSPLVRHSIRLDRMESRVLADPTTQWNIELFSPHPEQMNCSNNCSLVAKFIPKRDGFRYLVTGDTEVSRWEAISSAYKGRLRAEVMAAPHHGSKSAVHLPSLRFIEPRHVLVSAGVNNPFKHPHDEALRAYSDVAAKVFSTHEGKSFRTHEGWWDLKTVEWSPQA